MIDPVLTPLLMAGVTWLGGALTSETAQSITTNVASSQLLDPVCRRVRHAVGARMSGADGSMPRNHDVERAVRTAQLQANRALIADFGARAKARNAPSDISFATEAAAWVEAQYSAIGTLQVSDTVREATVAAIDASLSDRTAVADDKTLRDQARTATQVALAELEAAMGGRVPERFRLRFLSTDPAERPWFDAFGAFLAEQVKTAEAFRSILTAARLAEIGAGVRRIEDMADQWATLAGDLRRTADEALERLGRIETKVDDVRASTARIEQALALLVAERGAGAADVEALRAERDQLKAHGEIKDRAYEGFLAILREQPIPPEQWATQLATFAERYQALLAESRTRTNLPHDLEAERQRAETAIEAGDLDGADAILGALSKRMAESREQAGREEAKICARRAEIAKTQLRYYAAAALFGQAAALEPQTDLDAVWHRLMDQASVLNDQGREFGDNAACEQAIAVYRRALVFGDRERAPLHWAMTQNNLGTALSALGERESGSARLDEAVVVYREALQELTRERVPLDWAMTQNDLGNALLALGQRERGTARFDEAVEAYGEALQERTRERVPLDWAMTQNNLGNALSIIGERESGTWHLDAAVAAYREALLEWTRERVPLNWAGTQNNLGNALLALGLRDSATGCQNEAVEAYRAALLEWTRERVPLNWAGTQNNLGNALLALARRESGTGRLDEAVTAYRAALEERTRARTPYPWANTQENLATTCAAIFDKTGDETWLDRGLEAARGALEVYEAAGADYDVGTCRNLIADLEARRRG